MNTIYRTEDLPVGICVLVDGGCKGNELPVSRMTEREMYGSMTVFHKRVQVMSTLSGGGTAVIHHYEQHPDRTNLTSNQSELDTLHAGLLYVDDLRERMLDGDRKLGTVTVLCDNKLALGLACGQMKLNRKSHSELHAKLEQIMKLMRNLDVAFQHVDNLWVKSILGH